MVTVDFFMTWRWLQDIKTGQVVEFQNDENIHLDLLDVDFDSSGSMFKWIDNNEDKINRQRLLVDLDYMLEPEYFRQRFEGVEEAWVIIKPYEALIVKGEVPGSIKIKVDSYDNYVEDMKRIIFN